MTKKLNPLFDPRGFQERPVLKLAPRPTLAQLKKGKILFYNNTKLDFCNYGETFVGIKERFVEMGIANFVDCGETVREIEMERIPTGSRPSVLCWAHAAARI